MPCSICGSEQASGVRFCANCGWAANAKSAARSPLPGAKASGTVGATPGVLTPTTAPADAARGTTRATTRLSREFERAGPHLKRARALVWDDSPRLQEFVHLGAAAPGGLRGSVLVAAICLAITLLLWGPLSLPAGWINAGVKWIMPRSCETLGLLTNICTSAAGLMTWIGSFLVLGGIYLFRRQVSRALTPVANRIPADYRFLGAPVLGTILFIIVWAGNSFHWWTRPGLVRDGLFPVVVGLLTHLMFWHGPGLQRRLAALMDQTVTDARHSEAYGAGQADLETATQDPFRHRDLIDPQQVGDAVTYKVDHWLDGSDQAAKSGDMVGAVTNLEEAQRQLIKQTDNMVLKRTDAMASAGNAPGAAVPQAIRVQTDVLKLVDDGILTPSQAESVLESMGTSTAQAASGTGDYVAGLQVLRRPGW